MARRQDGVSAPETRAGRMATSVRMTLGQESWPAMRKAIPAALEGDLIRGSRRPGRGPRWGGRSVHLGGGFAMTHERRDLRANELRASLSPMQASFGTCLEPPEGCTPASRIR